MLLSSILRRKGMILNRNLMTKIQHTDLLQTQGFIDGKWTNGTCDHRFPVTGENHQLYEHEIITLNVYNRSSNWKGNCRSCFNEYY